MKKIVLGILLVCFCLTTTTAFAGQPYLSGSVGAFMPTDSDLSSPFFASEGIASAEISYDTGMALSLALGQDLDSVRVEGELSYKTADMDKLSATGFFGESGSGPIDGDISSLSVMCNAWKDIKTGGTVTPYVGLGIGFAKLDAELEGESESDTVFAYQLGLGLGIALQENLILDLSYRYFATSDPDFDGLEAEFASNNVMAGLRMNF